MCDKPADMIRKYRDGSLQVKYTSAFSKTTQHLKYAFEGDDSAISTSEDLTQFAPEIEKIWESMGFRMKLVFVKENGFLTFTGYNFGMDADGPTGMYIPEIARNVASASWSCSSELKSHPERVHSVGAAAMLARAEQFKDCGPFCRYFASLGEAHAKYGDMALGEVEAMRLGIAPMPSVRTALKDLMAQCKPMTKEMRNLVHRVIPLSKEQELNLLHVTFDDPFDVDKARRVLPYAVWDPAKFEKARR